MASTAAINITNGRKNSSAMRKIAAGLGWFSVGMGVAEIVAPGAVSKLIGVKRKSSDTRWRGVRKLAAGIGLMQAPQSGMGLLTRAGANVLELSRMRSRSRRRGSNSGRAAIGLAALAGVAAICVKQARAAGTHAEPIRHTSATVVNKSAEECYRF